MSATAAPAALSSSLKVGVQGRAREPARPCRAPRSTLLLKPVFSQHLAFPRPVTDKQPDACPGRRQNGGVGSRPSQGVGRKECGSGKQETSLNYGFTWSCDPVQVASPLGLILRRMGIYCVPTTCPRLPAYMLFQPYEANVPYFTHGQNRFREVELPKIM